MSSKLKSWFFSTIRNTNSRGKYVNFNDGSEPDEVTFQNLLDATVLKKADGDYQDQADYVAVNAESNDKFTTADNLPIVENSVDGSITLDITAATTNSEKIKYKINPHFVSDIDQISPDRDTNVFVNPNNLPKVAVEIVGTPIVGQSPLVVGNTITSELDIVNFYETFKLKLNVLTSSFISHSGVLLSTVLNTLRADVDAKVSDAELASEVSILNSSILTKATKVTPSIGLNGNGTKVTVNAEGVVTNINKANASDLKNDSSVAGSTIKDALNNLNSSLTGDLIATVVPNISTEISDFNAIAGTKHFVDTSAGNIICSLPAVIDSASGDLIMVYKSTSDTNTITVVDTHLSFVLLQHKDNALFHFSDDRWSFVGIASPISQTVTDGITDKSPSENAVFDAVYAKGLINGTIWVNAYTALGNFNLSIDKYNNVGYTDAEGPISVILPTFNSAMSGKTIIVEPHRFNDGLTTVNISIPGLQKDGGGGAGTYTEVITKMGQIVTIQANYYGWHVIGHTNQVPDISFKLDLDGGNANQDIDIDGFGVNAKHFKVNGTAGAGHIGLKHQSANISASASESSIGADSVGDPVWKNDGGAIDKLELQSNKTSTVTGNEASTSKYLTVKGVYDWAVGLFAPKASPTFTGTITTPDIIVSGATASTIAHFDGSKNIESLPLATYPSLTDLSYVKGVTSAIQTQLDSNTVVETWSTNADYTISSTTAKTLKIVQTGTLTAPRQVILSILPAGSIVTIIGGVSVTATNFISLNGFVNGLSSFPSAITLAYGSVTIYSLGGGFYTTNKPQFTETTTALTATKTIRGDAIGGGWSSSYTAPFTSPSRGDLKWHLSGGLMAYDGSLNQILAPYDPMTGWMDYRPSGRNIKYWNQQDIASGNKPIEYSTNFGYCYYWAQTYKVILRGEGSDEYCEYTVYVDGSGIPSIQKTHKSSATLTMSIVSGGLRVAGPNCYAYIYKQGRLTALENPDLNQSFSNDGLSNYWSGNIGVGHTSQNASAILQADSTSKGFLPPRMTNVQRTSIAGGTPPVGLIVYCTDATEGLYIYKSTGWIQII